MKTYTIQGTYGMMEISHSTLLRTIDQLNTDIARYTMLLARQQEMIKNDYGYISESTAKVIKSHTETIEKMQHMLQLHMDALNS